MLVHPCPCEPVWRAAEYSLMMEAENVSETLGFYSEVTRLLPKDTSPSRNNNFLMKVAEKVSETGFLLRIYKTVIREDVIIGE
jgi:hypothetical protein